MAEGQRGSNDVSFAASSSPFQRCPSSPATMHSVEGPRTRDVQEKSSSHKSCAGDSSLRASTGSHFVVGKQAAKGSPSFRTAAELRGTLQGSAQELSSLLELWEDLWCSRSLLISLSHRTPSGSWSPLTSRLLLLREPRTAPPPAPATTPSAPSSAPAAVSRENVPHPGPAPSLGTVHGRQGQHVRGGSGGHNSTRLPRPKRSSSVDGSYWLRGGGEREEWSALRDGCVRSISENESGSVLRGKGGTGSGVGGIGGAAAAQRLVGDAGAPRKPLTDMDLEELRGFFDLGFDFSGADPSPRMTATLPALELYHAVESVQQRLLREQQRRRGVLSQQPPSLQPMLCEGGERDGGSGGGGGIYPPLEELGLLSVDSPPEPWILPSPRYHPADMKMHLRVWAQTVACTVRQAC